MESGEGDHHQETILFHSYPCAYYVQSPSTISHANSTDLKSNTLESTLLFTSPTRSDTNLLLNKHPDASRFDLSRYSSSRGSNNSFGSNDHHHQKKIISGGGEEINAVNRLVIVDGRHGFGEEEEEEEEEEYLYYGRSRGCWWRYCSFRRSNSCVWTSFQLVWRLLVSFGVALLIFYLFTKPPPPKISIKMAGIGQFGLGEGVDGSGVATKILTCNCSLDLIIDNKSKIFGLHMNPPLLQMSFARLPLATSRGPSKLYAESRSLEEFELLIGTRNRPMYGAGRNMQDMLESGSGLPLVISVSLSSNYRMVWDLIKPKFHHRAECLLILESKYDKKRRTQAYNSTCAVF